MIGPKKLVLRSRDPEEQESDFWARIGNPEPLEEEMGVSNTSDVEIEYLEPRDGGCPGRLESMFSPVYPARDEGYHSMIFSPPKAQCQVG